jgi:hypothetical protein
MPQLKARTRKRTLANLTDWPAAQVEACARCSRVTTNCCAGA